MDCRRFDGYIDLYIDDMLNERDSEEFKEHLALCTGCMAKLEDTQKLVSIIGNLDEEPLPEGFRDSLFRVLDEGEGKGRDWIKWLGVAASIIVMLISMRAMKDGGLMDGREKAAMPLNEAIEAEDNSFDMDFENSSESMEESRGMYGLGDGEDPVNLGDTPDEAKENLADSQMQICTDVVEVYVQDVCISPQTLRFMAMNSDLELVESDEESVVVEILDDEQRGILYEELSKMGQVKDVGENKGGSRIRIFIRSQE